MRALIATALAGVCLFASGCSTSPGCGPTTCSGCCDKSGKCQSGDKNDVCGGDGKACGACATGTVCYFRVCAIPNGTGGGGSATGGGTGTGGGAGGAGGGGVAMTKSTHFGPLTHWAVPDSTGTGGFFAANSSSGTNRWALFDIDGDGKPDLVQTADPASSGPSPFVGISASYWRVYLNNGTGFSTTATTWNLPAQANATEFNLATGTDGKSQWATVDLNHDGKPDLVRTTDPDAGQVPFDGGSSDYWELYSNGGSSFSTGGAHWTLPSSGSPSGFFATAASTPSFNWSLFDLDGDGTVDLVQTSDPKSSDGVFTDGSGAFWRVFKIVGNGFDPTPLQWRVPDSTTAGGYYVGSTAGPLRNWGLFDLDGDGAPELVQTSDPTKIDQIFLSSGMPIWHAYLNTKTQSMFLATATPFAVPDSTTDGGFYEGFSFAAPQVWATIDLDSDGRADLVQTADPAKTKAVFRQSGSSDFWKVFAGSSSGFGAASNFGVPDSGTGAGFYSAFGAGGAENWALIDLDGDGRIDLVQTGDPAQMNHVFSAGTGFEWHVYRGAP